jgi:hypothetical protein
MKPLLIFLGHINNKIPEMERFGIHKRIVWAIFV